MSGSLATMSAEIVAHLIWLKGLAYLADIFSRTNYFCS